MKKGETLRRDARLDRAALDDDSRTVTIALSSTEPVRTLFGDEVLRHDAESVDLTRDQGNGLPLLWGHDRDVPIGRVRNLRIEGDRLRGDATFSESSERARAVYADVRDGFLDSVSIGYRINDFVAGEHDAYEVTDWTPLEASIVSVPADATVGVGRSHTESKPMTEETRAGTDTASPPANPVPNVADLTAAHERARDAGRLEGARAEQERQATIRAIFASFGSPQYLALRDACLESATTPDQARAQLLELIGKSNGPVVGDDYHQPNGRMHDEQTYRDVATPNGEDEAEKWRRGVAEALDVRANMLEDDEKGSKRREILRSNPFLSMTLSEIARDYLSRCKVSMAGLSREAIAGQAFIRSASIGQGAHSTSDFASVLADMANKAMLIGWGEAEETWSMVSRSASVPDFKPQSFIALSNFPTLDTVLEGGEFKHKTMEDVNELLTLVTFGNLFSISRQAIVNDDLNAFTAIPATMGRAANRKLGDLVWNILINNPALNQDGIALFDAQHNNIGTPAIPSTASVEEARAGMGVQADPVGVVIGLRPTIMMVPLELEGTAIALAGSEYDPDATAGTLTLNTVRETYVPVAEHRLSADSATQWYMSSNPNNSDTLIIGFLNGQTTPFLDSMNGWTVDGVEYKVRIDAAAIPADYRGLWRNAGL